MDGATIKEIPKQDANGNDPCIPPGLYAPSSKALTVNRDEVRRAVACLNAAGETYSINTTKTPDGLQEVMPYPVGAPKDTLLTKEAWNKAPS
jgi:two-component system sensor histidine kinase BaeS